MRQNTTTKNITIDAEEKEIMQIIIGNFLKIIFSIPSEI